MMGKFFPLRSRITGEMERIYLGEGWILSHKLRSREMFQKRILDYSIRPDEHWVSCCASFSNGQLQFV
jgi:hypothetical protein